MAQKSKQLADPAKAPLTPSQRRFVDEYLIDLNGTRAYSAAFPAATYQVARVGAAALLSKPHIRAEVSAARRAQQRRTRVTADKVLRELARVAFSDVLDLFDGDGHLRPVQQIPLGTRKAVTGVRVTRERTTTRVTRNGKTRTTTTVRESVAEYKFANKLDALGQLCRYLGLAAPIPPLEALLAVFPKDVSTELRQSLSGTHN